MTAGLDLQRCKIAGSTVDRRRGGARGLESARRPRPPRADRLRRRAARPAVAGTDRLARFRAASAGRCAGRNRLGQGAGPGPGVARRGPRGTSPSRPGQRRSPGSRGHGPAESRLATRRHAVGGLGRVGRRSGPAEENGDLARRPARSRGPGERHSHRASPRGGSAPTSDDPDRTRDGPAGAGVRALVRAYALLPLPYLHIILQ